MDYRSGLPDFQVFSGGSAWIVSDWPGWPLGRFLGAGEAPGRGWLGERVSGRVWLSVSVSVYRYVSVYPCVTVWPPAYLAGVHVNVSVTVPAYCGYCMWQSGREVAENVNKLGEC